MECQFVEVVPFKRAGCLNLAVVGGSAHRNQLLGVGADHESRTAGREYVLACASELAESVYEILLDPRRVKRILRLVYKYWVLSVREQNHEDCGAFLSVRQVFDAGVLLTFR